MPFGARFSRPARPVTTLAPLASLASLAALASLALITVAPPALASPAADKATARALATDGIALYNEGDCKGAIDLLQRAEQLYSAPVHLLYVARCQAKTGKLIEAAETYRAIKRMKLQPDSPEQFKAAVQDADDELQTVAAEIPRLILNVAPQPEGVVITINGDEVPAAILGIERLTNPGEKKITVTAPGFEPNDLTITLKRSEVRELEIPLTPTGGLAAVAPTHESPAGQAPENDENGKSESESKVGPNGIVWFVGAQFGAFIPSGDVTKGTPLTDLVSAGGGAELIGGLTFARYFTPFAFLTGYTLTPSSTIATRLTGATATGAMGGAGMRFGTPRRQLGGYGELAFARSGIGVQGDIKNTLIGCSATVNSSALRFGGGILIPIADIFELSPAVNFTVGKFSSVSVGGGAACAIGTALSNGDIPTAERGNYAVVQIGIDGEFVFGGHQ